MDMVEIFLKSPNVEMSPFEKFSFAWIPSHDIMVCTADCILHGLCQIKHCVNLDTIKVSQS